MTVVFDQSLQVRSPMPKQNCLHPLQRWFHLLLLLGLLVGGLIFQPEPAFASVHRYDEAAAQVMYRSQQSLRDTSDQAWQAVLYKRVKAGDLDTLHLRLIGFPGVAEVDRTQPLQISTDTGTIWQAKPALEEMSFPANVGEFDMQAVMKQLTIDLPLWLTLSLKNGQTVKLIAPPFVVKEWRSIAQQSVKSQAGT
jgi:hypothetical protein